MTFHWRFNIEISGSRSKGQDGAARPQQSLASRSRSSWKLVSDRFIVFVCFADGADYLREILPAFFVHHSMSVRRLRRLVHHLPAEDGKTQGVTAGLDVPELDARLRTWIASAAAKQIRQLPDVLKRIGADGARERLQSKLQRVDAAVQQLCGAQGNEVEAV